MSNSDDELTIEPPTYTSPRRYAVFAESYWTMAYYKEPFWNKQAEWEYKLFVALSGCHVFKDISPAIIEKLVRATEIQLRYPGQNLAVQGEPANSMFIVLAGNVNCYRDDRPVAMHTSTKENIIDEAAVLWGSPRKFSLIAGEVGSSEVGNAAGAVGECIVGKLNRTDFVNLTVRRTVFARMDISELMRKAKLLEMMDEEQVAKLADIFQTRLIPENGFIVKHHDPGHEFFIVLEGIARVWVKDAAGAETEYCRYGTGDLFGELALLRNQPRAANVSAVTALKVIVLGREQFDRLFGTMAQIQEEQYQRDPRKQIADFYDRGDRRGPLGSLKIHGLKPDPANHGSTDWFVVYRPTSKDAIMRMLSGSAVGKGLNIKGKSSKQGILSGLVPFVQISDNKHKSMIEVSPPSATLKIFFKTRPARDEAKKTCLSILADGKTPCLQQYKPSDIKFDDHYVTEGGRSGVFGIIMPEALLREAWIMKPDLSPVVGWESGRRSEPAFMDMNMHGIRDGKEPVIVLYQFDESDTMNPRGLLVAYAEALVKPVVSDFDTFTVGSKNMLYEPLALDQAEIVVWALEQTRMICSTPDHNPWTTRWLEVIKTEGEKGYHPVCGKYGFGDPTSISLISDVVQMTSPIGAIRHGAESCNFFFPQELDDDFLVIHHDFPDKPWDYFTEEKVRFFLMDRVKEGFAFPINAVWPVRDKGWYAVYESLMAAEHSRVPMASWFPPESKIIEKIAEVHKAVPNGFNIISAPVVEEKKKCRDQPEPAAQQAATAKAPAASNKNAKPDKPKKKWGLF